MRRLPSLICSTALFCMPLGMGAAQTAPVPDGVPNQPDLTPAFAAQIEAPAQTSDFALSQSIVAEGLEHPWAVTVLPDDEGYLVTERSGALRHVSCEGVLSDPISGTPDVFARRQGGLLDVEIAPDFAQSRVIYLTYSKPMGNGRSTTAAARAVLSADATSLSGLRDIFIGNPPSSTPMHYGSRIVADGAGAVFITTGEHSSRGERVLAQDLSTTYGKVIRVEDTGQTPEARIYSYGHRNIQGAALATDGRLWTIEHGPAGGDELNIIEAGANYGWPIVSYGVNYNGSAIGTGAARHAPDFTEPRYYWDPVIAPGGMVFYEGAMFPEWSGDILASGLVASALVRLDINGDSVAGEERLLEGIGRVRDVAIDHDGALLIVLDLPDAPLVRIARGL